MKQQFSSGSQFTISFPSLPVLSHVLTYQSLHPNVEATVQTVVVLLVLSQGYYLCLVRSSDTIPVHELRSTGSEHVISHHDGSVREHVEVNDALQVLGPPWSTVEHRGAPCMWKRQCSEDSYKCILFAAAWKANQLHKGTTSDALGRKFRCERQTCSKSNTDKHP